MQSIVTMSDTQARSLEANGNRYEIRDFVGSYDQPGAEPQAFLVRLETPYGRIRPHFHEVDQFQLVVSGSGTLAPRTPLIAGGVLYTDSYTPYGPIVAGEEGIEFFTLRPSAVTGAQYMPEARHSKPVRAGQRFVAAAPLASDSVPPLPAPERLGGTADGAEAFLVRAEAGSRLQRLPARARDREGYYIVLSGNLEHEGRVLAERTCCHHRPGEAEFAAIGGPGGAVVAYLAFAAQNSPRSRGAATS